MSDHVKYGGITAIAIFFVGWSTGLGGSLIPNLIFSALMGVFAAFLYALAKKYAKQKD